jgi:hypothetical protein
MRCSPLATSLRRDAFICALAVYDWDGHTHVETGLARLRAMLRRGKSRLYGKTGSPQHQPFHPRRAAGLVIALDQHGAQADIAVGRFEARRHTAEKPFDH